MYNLINSTLDEIAFFNPPEHLKKGREAKKIPMGFLQTFNRKILGYEWSEYSSGPKFRNGDTLVAKITPCLENGKTAFVDILDNEELAFGSSEFIVLRPRTEADTMFLYYLSISPTFRKRAISCMEGTSGRKRVNENTLKYFDFLIPKPESRLRIAEVLSTLDKKIELNNKINAELEAMAKLIYDYWFVQFDFPDANGKPYKSSGGKMVYNESIKREIPDGWEVKALGKTVKTSLGGTPSTKKSEYWDNADIPWLNSGEVANFPALGSEAKITQTGVDSSAAEILPSGSVIISIVRHLRVSILAINAAFNQSVVGLYETDTLKNSFLYPYLCRELPRLMSLRTGAQQPHINKGIVDASLLVIPSSEILKTYYNSTDSIFEKINVAAMENVKLSELRDWLLPMLMNGQVTVNT